MRRSGSYNIVAHNNATLVDRQSTAFSIIVNNIEIESFLKFSVSIRVGWVVSTTLSTAYAARAPKLRLLASGRFISTAISPPPQRTTLIHNYTLTRVSHD
jgi:hypothetical protein